MELVPIQREVFFRKCIRGTRFYLFFFTFYFRLYLKRKYVYGDSAVWDGAVWDIPTLSWQFVTNLRFGELVGNSYECFCTKFRGGPSSFFPKNHTFHTNEILRIDTTPPLRKIVTFSHEVGLDIRRMMMDMTIWSGGAGWRGLVTSHQWFMCNLSL